jgi:hypothetical protein
MILIKVKDSKLRYQSSKLNSSPVSSAKKRAGGAVSPGEHTSQRRDWYLVKYPLDFADFAPAIYIKVTAGLMVAK